MTVARTVEEAAYGPFLDHRSAAEGFYVERPAHEEAGITPPAVSVRIRDSLLGWSRQGAHPKLLLTGQTGSGKSSELARLESERNFRERFERVEVGLSESLNDQHAEMRAFLVAIAAGLAKHLTRTGLTAHLDPDFAGWLRGWLDGLGSDVGVAVPPDVKDVTAQLGVPFAKLSMKLRDDATMRHRVLDDRSFAVSELVKVCEGLGRAVQAAAERPVLLILDDGDKLTSEGPARDIFIENFGAFTQLPFAAIVTYPYWMSFMPEVGRTRRLADAEFRLENVKVFSGPADTELRADARSFFARVAASRLAVGLVADEAVEQAARHSAGIPREFIRILRRSCELAVNLGLEAVSLQLVDHTLGRMRSEMSRATQADTNLESLVRVRTSKRLRDAHDWLLLRSLLVVELTNGDPWYDVHPILQGYVDERAEG